MSCIPFEPSKGKNHTRYQHEQNYEQFARHFLFSPPRTLVEKSIPLTIHVPVLASGRYIGARSISANHYTISYFSR
jgi:hypothetical protein